MAPLRVLVTGANTGIGFATCRGLMETAEEGMVVHVACRSREKAVETVQRLVEEAAAAATPVPQRAKSKAADQAVHVVPAPPLELSDLDSVARFVKEFREPLDVLVENAGIMLIPNLQLTKQGVELTVGVNHVAHQALLEGLERNLLEGARTNRDGVARVVVVSSDAHLMPKAVGPNLQTAFFPSAEQYQPWEQYGLSKLFNIYSAASANREWARDRKPLVAFSLHPGVVATELMRHMDPQAMRSSLSAISASSSGSGSSSPSPTEKKKKDKAPKMAIKTPDEGAATTLHVIRMPMQHGTTRPPLADPVQYFSDSQRVDKMRKLATDAALADDVVRATRELLKAKGFYEKAGLLVSSSRL